MPWGRRAWLVAAALLVRAGKREAQLLHLGTRARELAPEHIRGLRRLRREGLRGLHSHIISAISGRTTRRDSSSSNSRRRQRVSQTLHLAILQHRLCTHGREEVLRGDRALLHREVRGVAARSSSSSSSSSSRR